MSVVIRHLETVAQNAINQLSSMNIPPNAVIVFDIDDTLIRSIDGSCIKQIVMVYNYAKMLGIRPILITFRRDLPDVLYYTKKQLIDCGIIGYDSLYLCPPDITDPWKYKYGARKDIHMRGMKVVMSIGDEDWDVSGGYTGVGIKV